MREAAVAGVERLQSGPRGQRNRRDGRRPGRAAARDDEGEADGSAFHAVLLVQRRARAITANENPGSGYWKTSSSVRSSSRFFASKSTQSGPATRTPKPA